MIKKAILAIAILSVVTACNSQKKTTNNNTKTNTNTSQTRPEQNQNGGQRGQRPSIDEMFSKMDTNGDGQLSSTEIKGPLAEKFSTIDTNGNGFVSKSELANAPKPERRQGGPGGGQGAPRR